MARRFIINEGLSSEKTVEAAQYIHQDGLWTFVDHDGRQVYSIRSGRVESVEAKPESE